MIFLRNITRKSLREWRRDADRRRANQREINKPICTANHFGTPYLYSVFRNCRIQRYTPSIPAMGWMINLRSSVRRCLPILSKSEAPSPNSIQDISTFGCWLNSWLKSSVRISNIRSDRFRIDSKIMFSERCWLVIVFKLHIPDEAW